MFFLYTKEYGFEFKAYTDYDAAKADVEVLGAMAAYSGLKIEVRVISVIELAKHSSVCEF